MTPQARVQRVRFTAAGALPPPQARRRCERWIADLDPVAGGLPPQAIVVVRRLGVPAAALQADAARSEAWQHTLRALARPALADVVGAGVQGVWFEDEAELMACAARDALRGTLAARWWWTLVLAPHADLPAVVQRWAGSPRALPAATGRLEPAQARAWWQAIGEPGRAALGAALAQAYPVSAAVRAALQPAAPSAPGGAGQRADVMAPVEADPRRAGEPVRPAPATEAQLAARWVELMHQLAGDAQAAVGDALPARWRAQGAAPPAPRHDGACADGHAPAPVHEPRARSAAIGSPAPSPAVPTWLPPHARPPAASAADARLPAVGSTPPPPPPPPAPAAAAQAEPVVPIVETAALAHPLPTAPRRAPAPARAVTADTPLHTGFGGLFFLLNAMLAAGWYGDFTQPRHPGLPLSPWRLLHEAGRRHFGRAYGRDPLAAWLLAKALRSPMPTAPPCWSAPPAWTSAPCGRPWHALVAPGDVRWWHPGGFIAARAPSLDAVPAGALPPGVPLVVRPVRARPLSLAQLLLPVLATRLALALGLPDARAAAALALRLPARLAASDGRLDLHLPLAALPLAVRLAGLDRDPGWIPAAGCDFRFHFG